MNLKLNFLVITIIFSAMAYSQTVETSKLPNAKTVMFELNFNPLGQGGVFSFDNMQGKYWLNKTTVLRLGVGYNTKSNGLSDDDYDSKELHKTNLNEKTSLLTLKPGMELRLLKNSIVSPYVGMELVFKNKSSLADYKEYIQAYDNNTGKYIYNFVETKIDGAWRSYTTGTYTNSYGNYTTTSTSYTAERAFSSFGTNLILGSDVYFMKNMYAGFEVGLGYQSTLFNKVVLDISTNVDKTTYPSFTASNLSFYYNSAIRLGVWF